MANVNEGERWTLWVCANGACDPSSLPGVCRCRTEPRPGIISYAERVAIEVGPTDALREAKAEVARLREVLDRFGGHRGDCNVIAGAPNCNCGFDEAYVRVRQAARGSESESKTGGHE